MWRRTHNHWGHSPLDQIDTTNVGSLRLAWAWTMAEGIQETTPLVHDGVMFLVQACDYVEALDVRDGTRLWEYRRERVEHGARLSCATRNGALFEDKLFIGTHDAHLVALDARTGEVVWDEAVGDWEVGQHYSGGPQVIKGRVVAGMSGCYHLNTRCWISAHDAETGREVWRTYTIPRPGEFGYDTWGGIPDEMRRGGLVVERAELRRGAEPHLRRRRGADSVGLRAARHRGRRRPLHQLHPRHRRRHGRDRLVLPAHPERRVGPRPPLRPARGRDRGVARPGRRRLGERRDHARLAPQDRDRHPGQDRHRLGPRCRHRGVPLGRADEPPERGGRRGCREPPRHPQRVAQVPASRRAGLRVPQLHRRHQLAGNFLPSRHQRPLRADQQRLHEPDPQRVPQPSRAPTTGRRAGCPRWPRTSTGR